MPEKCTFGMIMLGIKIAPIAPNKGFRWELRGGGKVVFKGKSYMSSHAYVCVNKGGSLEVGNEVHFSYGALIHCSNKIVLGDKLRVSWNCTLIDTDFHPLIDTVSGRELKRSSPIILGKGCWLGHDCILSKGVRLAENTTVSSGSVVKGRFKKSNIIIGGNPAVMIDEGYVRDDCYDAPQEPTCV